MAALRLSTGAFKLGRQVGKDPLFFGASFLDGHGRVTSLGPTTLAHDPRLLCLASEEERAIISDLLDPVSKLVSSLPSWSEYPLVALFAAWVIWRRATELVTMFGLGLATWVAISSARSYADHGDPYLALRSGVGTLIEQLQQVLN